MAEMLFLLSLFVPPIVVALSLASMAIGAIPHGSATSAVPAENSVARFAAAVSRSPLKVAAVLKSDAARDAYRTGSPKPCHS